jgi:hypothetical protein
MQTNTISSLYTVEMVRKVVNTKARKVVKTKARRAAKGKVGTNKIAELERRQNQIVGATIIEQINEWKDRYRYDEKKGDANSHHYLRFIRVLWLNVVNGENYRNWYKDIIPNILEAVHLDSPMVDDPHLYQWDFFFPTKYTSYLTTYCLNLLEAMHKLRIPMNWNSVPKRLISCNKNIIKLYPHQNNRTDITTAQLQSTIEICGDMLWNYSFVIDKLISLMNTTTKYQKDKIMSAIPKYISFRFTWETEGYKMWDVTLNEILAICKLQGVTQDRIDRLSDSDPDLYQKMISECFIDILSRSNIDSNNIREMILGIFAYGIKLDATAIVVDLIETELYSVSIPEIYRILMNNLFLILELISDDGQNDFINYLYLKDIIDNKEILKLSCMGYGDIGLLMTALDVPDIDQFFDPNMIRTCTIFAHENITFFERSKLISCSPINIMTELKIEPTPSDIKAIFSSRSLYVVASSTIITDSESLKLLNNRLASASEFPNLDDKSFSYKHLDLYTRKAYVDYVKMKIFTNKCRGNRRIRGKIQYPYCDMEFILRYNPTITRDILHQFAKNGWMDTIARLFCITNAYDHLIEYFDYDLIINCMNPVQRNWAVFVMRDRDSVISKVFDFDGVYRYSGDRGAVEPNIPDDKLVQIHSLSNIDTFLSHPSRIDYIRKRIAGYDTSEEDDEYEEDYEDEYEYEEDYEDESYEEEDSSSEQLII